MGVEAGKLLADARRAARLTQAELAQRLGVSQGAVAQLERPGANPTVATLERTLRALGKQLTLEAAQARIDRER
jgi:transcriptional regulator with XRE-family HTH domain